MIGIYLGAGSGVGHPWDWNFYYPIKQIFVLGFSGRFIKKLKLFEELFEHGIFHGIIDLQENKLLKIKDKKCLSIIEWE
jgi:hypothetical protein